MSQNINLLDLIGIDLPIIQAPMAGSSGVEMAFAVSEAGGLGSLPCALLDAGQLKTELAEVTAKTSKPVNINFSLIRHPMPINLKMIIGSNAYRLTIKNSKLSLQMSFLLMQFTPLMKLFAVF